MNQDNKLGSVSASLFPFEFGTFQGFNYRTHAAIDRSLSAVEVLEWDHDRYGEARFCPSGDHSEMYLLLHEEATAGDLLNVSRLLAELGGDTTENFLRIYYAMYWNRQPLDQITAGTIEDDEVEFYIGANFAALRNEVALGFFQIHQPELYQLWKATPCNGLIFDAERFFRFRGWFTDEVRFGKKVALLLRFRAPCFCFPDIER